MSWQKVMERVLPPIHGIYPHETSQFGEVKGRQPPSSIPHKGADFNYSVGQAGINLANPEVCAPATGVVTSAGQGRYGRIAIRDVNGLSHEILHTHSQKVKIGQKVFAGEPIGTMGNTGVQDHHVHYQLIDQAGNRMNPATFWNRQSDYPRDYRQYLNISRTNSNAELDGSELAQIASGPPRYGAVPYPPARVAALDQQSLIDKRFGEWERPSANIGNNRPQTSVFDSGAPPIRYLSRIPSSDQQDLIDNRFGNWSATGTGATQHNSNLSAPLADPRRPGGIVTSPTVPLWGTFDSSKLLSDDEDWVTQLVKHRPWTK